MTAVEMLAAADPFDLFMGIVAGAATLLATYGYVLYRGLDGYRSDGEGPSEMKVALAPRPGDPSPSDAVAPQDGEALRRATAVQRSTRRRAIRLTPPDDPEP